MKELMNYPKQKGFSLVELMVAMVLGLIVVGGTISIFSGTMQSTRLNQALAQMQSNTRFATALISNDLRMAGFSGCASNSAGDFIVTANTPPTNNFDNTAVHGAVVNATDWSPGRPIGYDPPDGVGAPVEGTHVLMTQYALAPGNRLSDSMENRGADIDLVGANDELVKDKYAVISNCNNSELFSINNTEISQGDITINPALSLSQAYLYNSEYPESVRIMPFKSVMYYVGNTGRLNSSGDEIYSLYMQTFPYELASNPPLEIVEGVEQLQLSFGVKDGENYTFHSPDSATLEFSDAGLVKVGLLLTTNEKYGKSSVNRPYYLADNLVTVAGGSSALTYADDKRIRMAHNLSVKIRNRE